MKKAGIIGGAGFIGTYVTKAFLDHGFEVKVSATDPAKEDKYQHLRQFGNADRLEIVKLNVENKQELQDFVKDCEVVVHGGTPFILDVQDPQKQLFEPTIRGTENFLEVIRQTSGIKKVVFIASVAARNTNFPLPPDGKGLADTIGEEDAPFMSKESHPYAQAKFIANQTVEKFIQDHPALSFEISSVSPVFVIGKSLSGRQDSTSGGMQFLFKNRIAPDPFVQMMYDHDVTFAAVDVADVAHAIYTVATTNGLHGKNYLLSSETYHLSDISTMLNGGEPQRQPAIIYKNELAKKELKLAFRPVKETLHEYSVG